MGLPATVPWRAAPGRKQAALALGSKKKWLPRSVSLDALLAYANIVRPITLPFIAPAVVLVLWRYPGPFVRRLALAATAVVALALTLLPSVVYQYVSTGDPGISSNSAIVL